MEQIGRGEWAEEATRGILSRRERESARQELLDHMEDHMDSFLALGYAEEDALAHTLLAMGDPSLTAKLLRRAHQPILTRLLQVCRWAALLLALALVWNGIATADWREMRLYRSSLTDYRQRLERQLPQLAQEEGYTGLQVFARPENTLRVGDYTFATDGVWMLERSDGTWETWWLLEVRPDRFWQDPPRFEHPFRMDAGTGEGLIRPLGSNIFLQVGGRYSYKLVLNTSERPRALTWEYADPEGGFVYTVEAEGGDTVEKEQ